METCRMDGYGIKIFTTFIWKDTINSCWLHSLASTLTVTATQADKIFILSSLISLRVYCAQI